MSGKVFVTGASGFVGSAVVAALLDRGWAVAGLVNRRPVTDPRVEPIRGDLFDAAALSAGCRGAAAVIHLVGIIAERPAAGVTFSRIHDQGTAAAVVAAARAGIRRFVYVSALGARPDAPAAYHRTKFAAEQHVRSAELDWTVLQPSLVHGPRGDFTTMQAGWARGRRPPFLFMPYFGAGPLGRGHRYQSQPIFVDDVARAVAESLEQPRTIGEVYPLGGPDRLTWPQLHRAAADAIVGRPKPVVAIPAWSAKLLARVVPRPLLPFNRDQVLMSQEENTCDAGKFTAAFGWTPRPFDETVRAYAGTV